MCPVIWATRHRLWTPVVRACGHRLDSRFIDRYVSFDFVGEKLRASYSETGRPSIDPEVRQSLAHKIETHLLVDQAQQMIFRNLIFQTEVVEQTPLSERDAPS